MFNVKNVAVSAAVGFALSFLISIIATSKFPISLLRAFIFALVFAGIAFAVDFLGRRFLGVDSVSEKTNQTEKSSSKAGSVVDITIDDENLTEEEAAPSFDISASKYPEGLRSSGYGSYASLSSSQNEKTELNKPISAEVSGTQMETSSEKTETAGSISEDERSQNDAPGTSVSQEPNSLGKSMQEHPSSSGEKVVSSEEIDTLPDIGSFSESSSDGDEDEDDMGIISDSDFAQLDDEGQSYGSSSSKDVSVEHDTKTIASAIRTLLKRDEM